MPKRHACSIRIFQGMRGRGKTNAVKFEYQHDEPMFIVDIRNEYPHIPKFISFSDVLNWGLRGAKLNPSGKAQYRFCLRSESEYIKLFRLFTHFENCTMIWDEADALFNNKKFSTPLIDTFLGSRNNGLHLVMNSKRPFLIPVMVRSQVDEWFIFQTEEDRDINYLEKRFRTKMPKDPYKLDVGECIFVKSGQTPKLKTFPLFIPSSNGN